MILKTLAEFRSSIQQLPALQAVHRKDRRRFLIDAYKLANAKYQKEQWMESARKDAKAMSPSITKFLNVARHLMNALKEIEKARGAVPTNWPKLMRHLQVLEAAHLLRLAYDDLGFLIGMDIAAIHPHHRTSFKKRHRAIYSSHGFFTMVEERFTDMPARRSRLDYLLVGALSSRLDECATSTGRPLRPIIRYRIISRVFLDALTQIYPEGTVKTALLRI